MSYRAFFECITEDYAWAVKSFFWNSTSIGVKDIFTDRGCILGEVTIVNRFVWIECDGDDSDLYWIFFDLIMQEFKNHVAFIGLQGVGRGSTDFDPFSLTVLQQWDRRKEIRYKLSEDNLIKDFCKLVQIEGYDSDWRSRVIDMCTLGPHVKVGSTSCYLMLEELLDKTGNIEDRVRFKMQRFFEGQCKYVTRFEGDNLFYRVMAHFIYLEWARGNTGSPVKDVISGLKRMSLFR